MWPLKEEDIKDKKIFLLPTDTVYGLHARAFDKESVERLFEIKKRPKEKSFIVLIRNKNDLKDFGVDLGDNLSEMLDKLWPGPVSVILPVEDKFGYISKSGKIAFRVPSKKELLDFLNIVGPLVSTSANLSGENVCRSAKEAKMIFGKQVDIYVDEGVVEGKPSVVLDVLRF